MVSVTSIFLAWSCLAPLKPIIDHLRGTGLTDIFDVKFLARDVPVVTNDIHIYFGYQFYRGKGFDCMLLPPHRTMANQFHAFHKKIKAIAKDKLNILECVSCIEKALRIRSGIRR